MASAPPAELYDVVVESWVRPGERPPDPDSMPWHLVRSGPAGEPPEALPYRLLAQWRLEHARTDWRRGQPPRPPIDPTKLWHGPRAELMRQLASHPPKPATGPRGWPGLTVCQWQDVDAFLAAVERAR